MLFYNKFEFEYIIQSSSDTAKPFLIKVGSELLPPMEPLCQLFGKPNEWHILLTTDDIGSFNKIPIKQKVISYM